MTAFIYGKFTHGKTSYLLHTAYEVFKAFFHLKRVDAWLMALDHLFFNPIDGLVFVETSKSNIIPNACMDRFARIFACMQV